MAYLIADGLILAVFSSPWWAPTGVHPVPVRSAGRAGGFNGRQLRRPPLPYGGGCLRAQFASAIEEQLNASIQQQVAEGLQRPDPPDDVPLDGVLSALRRWAFMKPDQHRGQGRGERNDLRGRERGPPQLRLPSPSPPPT